MFERLKGVFAREQIPEVETETTTVPLAAAMLLLEVAWADHELEERELEQVKVALESMYAIHVWFACLPMEIAVNTVNSDR